MFKEPDLGVDTDLQDFVHSRIHIIKISLLNVTHMFEERILDWLPLPPRRENYSTDRKYKIAERQYNIESNIYKQIFIRFTDLIERISTFTISQLEYFVMFILDILETIVTTVTLVRESVDDLLHLFDELPWR